MSSTLPPTLVTETLGTKLRRLANEAGSSNKLTTTPWFTPVPWAQNTAYGTGQIVLNANSMYVAATAGTSNATSSGPANTTVANIIQDGTIQWLYQGTSYAKASANDAFAPTVTVTNSAPNTINSNLTLVWNMYANTSMIQNRFRFYGGYQNPTQFSYVSGVTFAANSSNLYSPGGLNATFMSDAPVIAIQFSSNQPTFGIFVEGRLLTPEMIPQQTPAKYVVIDWTNVGGKKTRKYEIVGMPKWNNTLTFQNIYTTPTDQIWAPETSNDLRAIFIGDSLWAGSNFSPWTVGDGMVQRIATKLGWNDPWNFSLGGTGFINAGTNNNYYTFPQRLPEALTRNPSIFVLPISSNDNGYTNTALANAILSVYQQIRQNSNAIIIQLGCMTSNSANYTTYQTMETVAANTVATFNDPWTYFIPIANDPTLPFITGSWNNTNVPGANNANLYINSSDNLHPTEVGKNYLGDRIATEIKRQVLPYIN